MKEFLIDILGSMGLAVWVEIITATPRCTYYFGPFANPDEAEEAKYGYLEDLRNEGAQGIVVTVKRCKPKELTIADDLDSFPSPGTQFFSGQMS
ncbi:MAG: DUF1816 domain-containing protein [Cyanobacteria bacterium]|nr:DUF1816 domain-containing protein [Cyanobacteriota bacterium]MDW8202465.1 DUF1816 domain-containing protein [Cyanobacteriota bacterium SKYGB_h_bin112]